MQLLSSNVVKALFTVLFGVILLHGEASAQTPVDSSVLQMNKQAMLAYSNLQFPESVQLLKQAESTCTQYNIVGNVLARTYINLGIVEQGGNGNNAGALEYFKKALCLDFGILLDPLYSNPDLEMLFVGAQNQASAPGVCSTMTTAPAFPQAPTQTQQPQSQPQAPADMAMQLIQHTPVTQQLRLSPVPIFAMVNDNVQVSSVLLFYRTIGEKIFQQVAMRQHAAGYAATIGCDVLQTFDPTGIEYYIAILDTNNQLLGTSGTEAAPHRISIVQVLTTVPPTLPNEPPPSVCHAECPPWNPDCNSNCKSFGDLCNTNSECCSGMSCVNNTCADGVGPKEEDKEPIDPFMRMSASFGTGIGLVTGGAEQPYNQVSDASLTIGSGIAMNKMHFRVNPMFYLPVSGLELGITFRGDLPLEPNYDEISTVAPSLLANVSYRLAGAEDHQGFQLHAMFGIGWMNMYHKVSYDDCQSQLDPDSEDGLACAEDDRQSDDDEDSWTGQNPFSKNFFRKAGAFGVELGLDGYYWFGNNVGLNFGLIADVLLPNFAVNLDIQAGLAVRF